MDEKLKVYDDKMTKTINNLGSELAAIRAGRANPHVLDKLTVDYYGVPIRSSSCQCICTGSTYDPDSAMGKEHVKRD